MNRRRPLLRNAVPRNRIPTGGGHHGTPPSQAPAARVGSSAGAARVRPPSYGRANTVTAGRRITGAPSGEEAEG